MNQLNQWEMEQNYHAALQKIYLDETNDVKIRHLAIISLKNGITKYWRKSARGAIQPAERELIKKNLLDYLHEPKIQLATAQAVVTSKIARYFSFQKLSTYLILDLTFQMNGLNCSTD